jgi:hypothetical protein
MNRSECGNFIPSKPLKKYFWMKLIIVKRKLVLICFPVILQIFLYQKKQQGNMP